MKLYYPKDHYNSAFRGQLFPLLKAFVKNKGFTDAQRLDMYGVSEEDYCFVDKISLAEVVILPMSWNYYETNQLKKLAKELILQAANYNLEVWSWNSGDYGVKTPFLPNLKVFRMSGYLSNHQEGHCGVPVFINDYFKKQQITMLSYPYTQKPIVGFCGQANYSKIYAIKEVFKITLRNLRSFLNLSYFEKQAIFSSTQLRASLLQILSKSKGITPNFIIRKSYRAGATTKKDRERTTKEFYDNIKHSQYVLCVRGAGNFSVRFYETLMMGRIPVYLHTDGFLPLQDKINWKKHVVWVDYEDRDQIDKVVVEFHQKLNEKSMTALQISNRKLWEEKLTLNGFFSSI